MDEVTKIFGSVVFNDDRMRERLPKETYEALQRTIKSGKALDLSVANPVAATMKDWALEMGATHFTHWFQPLTGITAEKHDGFITPAENGRVIMEFSGKELIKGESDASSFPSGGIRATFEARGYTAWDPTSPAFVKEGTLCIPTAFCSYGGEALDKKTPLLRSMQVVSRHALRVVKAMGMENVNRVITTVGPEQEYFLVDKKLYEKRPDLIFCGRTLFGTKPPKGQELEDHYFGVIKPRVAAYMKDLDHELWKLGILSKTKHNEAAPAQHELAPIFTTTNIATDHNQLTMEIMKKVADKHGMVCILHEKPFAGVNGSGKHNNWSLSTDTGVNLLEPGKTPSENIQFLLFLSAVIKAVDEHQDLLRISVASAGNDHRLGAAEAPPAIVSMYLGDELTEILNAVATGEHYTEHELTKMGMGAKILPQFSKDNSDRNRTSPFAFTGNKFEFRMLGSSASIADANVAINTGVAHVLREFADALENSNDVVSTAKELIRDVVKEHSRIIFNGDGYSKEWEIEAEKRGLLNLKSTVDAIELFESEKNVALFVRNHVFNETEVHSRCEIMLENYSKILHIEALTMLEMVRCSIIPAISDYIGTLSSNIKALRDVAPDAPCVGQLKTVNKLAKLLDEIYLGVNVLDTAVTLAEKGDNALTTAKTYREQVFSAMEALRYSVDNAEALCDARAWPFPKYSELLFGI